MNSFEFQKALKNRKNVHGTLLVAPSPRWADQIGNLGLDFVFIDTEHIALNRTDMAWMCKLYEAMGLAPLVRVRSNDQPYLVSQALDAGAAAVIAPYIETVDQVKALYGAIKLRPLKGDKLKGILNGTIELTEAEKAYLAKFNEGKSLFINIESTKGIENLDAMLDTGYVDAVVIGPHDLSVSLGVAEQWDSPVFINAVDEIIRKCVAKGVSVGNHFSYGTDPMIRWANLGMNIILYSSDIVSFFNTTKKDIDYIKEQLYGSKQKKEDVSVQI